jgi:hypothetical protein
VHCVPLLWLGCYGRCCRSGSSRYFVIVEKAELEQKLWGPFFRCSHLRHSWQPLHGFLVNEEGLRLPSSSSRRKQGTLDHRDGFSINRLESDSSRSLVFLLVSRPVLRIKSSKKLAMDHQTTPIATAGSTRLLRTVWYWCTCARIYSILSSRNGSAA